MVIDVLSNDCYALTNPGGNYTNNGYPTRTPTITSPNLVPTSTGLQAIGDGVISFGNLGNYCPGRIFLVPFGVGSSTNTFSLKVIGWTPTKLGVGIPLWVPTVLQTSQVTIGTAAGVAGADLGTTSLFATTITTSYGPTWITTGASPVAPDWFQLSPGSNDIGGIIVESLGFRFIEVIYTTGGSATSCNALYRKI